MRSFEDQMVLHCIVEIIVCDIIYAARLCCFIFSLISVEYSITKNQDFKANQGVIRLVRGILISFCPFYQFAL